MFRTTIDPTQPMRECTFVRFWCPIHGLTSTVSQLGLAAVLCFPCSQATAHVQQLDPWCSADLCDHTLNDPALKGTNHVSKLAITDEIIGGKATVDAAYLADYLADMFVESPEPEITGRAITALVDKVNRGENFDPECAYLGIRLQRL